MTHMSRAKILWIQLVAFPYLLHFLKDIKANNSGIGKQVKQQTAAHKGKGIKSLAEKEK